MAKLIKSYDVDTLTNLVIYTCPAGATAKVLVSYARIAGNFGTASIKFGRTTWSVVTSSVLDYPPSPPSAGEVPFSQPIELILSSGQKIEAFAESLGRVVAQICVIEESP